jgi:hypothetical protein
MLIAAALIVGGSIVYAFVPSDAGTWMLSAGIVLAFVIWLNRVVDQLLSKRGSGKNEQN